jgi:putative component of membrane protein insertase Oxa1/YidC/SpoIIIJ protein YidD
LRVEETSDSTHAVPADFTLPPPPTDDNEEHPVRDSVSDVAGDVAADGPLEIADAAVDAASSGICNGCDGCDVGGCDLPSCDCNLLLRVSTLLWVAALLVPARGGALVRVLLRGYRSRLTRFTPRCPSTPSCSAYALAAVESMGPRQGLAAASRRVRDCGRAAQQAQAYRPGATATASTSTS